MRLRFLYAPTSDLATAIRFYRDELGWDEAWREGERTVAFRIPDSGVDVMIDSENPDPPGPMYQVDDLTAFIGDHPDLTVISERMDIPDGSVIGYADPSGNPFYVFDQIGAS